MMLYWRGIRRRLEEKVAEKKPEEPTSDLTKFCAVCECVLEVAGRFLESPGEELIEVCEGCFETRPPAYREIYRKEDGEEC